MPSNSIPPGSVWFACRHSLLLFLLWVTPHSSPSLPPCTPSSPCEVLSAAAPSDHLCTGHCFTKLVRKCRNKEDLKTSFCPEIVSIPPDLHSMVCGVRVSLRRSPHAPQAPQSLGWGWTGARVGRQGWWHRRRGLRVQG